MKRFIRKVVYFLATAAVMLSGVKQSNAGILLDLVDPPGQTHTPYSLDFTATSSSTTLSIAGYQKPSYLYLTDISVTALGGGPNLLSLNWEIIPAPAFSHVEVQFDEGNGPVDGLLFASVGGLDTCLQSFDTSIGGTYTVSFLFTNGPSPLNAPGELVVSTVPEPSCLVLLGLGGIGLATGACRRRLRDERIVD